MTDVSTYIEMGLTALSSLIASVMVYLKLREDKLKHEVESSQVCKADLQELQTKVAVLEERINNEINMLDKLDDKLDQIRDKL